MNISDTKTDIVIDDTIHEIKTHAGFLRLYSDKDEILGDVPVYQINSILIEGSKINIPASLIKLCAEHKIPLHILTNQYKHYGSLHFTTDNLILIRQKQFQAVLAEKWQLYLAKQILHQKILLQLRLVQKWQNIDGTKLLEKSLTKVDTKSKLQALMGTEGQAAAVYWEVFGLEIINIESNLFPWPGRVKNPCTDPVNSMLSLAYGLLATQCQTSLTLNGLDPYLGILHKTNQDRPALTYDLMEIYRCLVVDLWVLGLIQQNIFKPEDFTKTSEGICTLFPHKKNEFFRLWFKRFKYYKFSTNYGQISLQEFINSNTKLLISWFDKIILNKERDTGRVDRFDERLITFSNIKEFSFIE